MSEIKTYASSTEKRSAEEHSEVERDVFDEVDWSLEPKLLRKLDVVMIPLFCLIYCANFIDRTAIGNAKIAGLERDLGLVGFQFNIALTIFYIIYILFDVPSNLALKHFGPIWIAIMVIAFGLVTIGAAFVHNYGQLIVTRVLLGIAESGTLSGLIYSMSRYYRRKELVLRIGLFFPPSAALAGAFGGLLASGLLRLHNIGTVLSWRKIFLVEGIITTGFGIICLFIIPADPQKSRMLSEPERKLALARIQADQVVLTGGKQEKTSLRLIVRSMNFNCFICTMGYLLINISFQGLSLFMPTVIATLGKFSTVESQLRTVPPYLVAMVWSLGVVYCSFKYRTRAIPCFISCLFLVLAYSIFLGTHNSHARYAACFFALMGGVGGGPIFLTWGTDNAAPETVRAVTTALITGLGTIGSVAAVWTYLPNDAPNYRRGNTLNLVSGCVVCLLSVIGYFYCKKENEKREKGLRNYRFQGRSAEEIMQLGFKHPEFRYQL